MQRNWVVEYRFWGRYPEDGSSYSCTGPYTKEEAKELADALNKEEELKNLLRGADQRETGEFFRAGAVELKQERPVKWHQDRIRHMERELKENKRRGSPDGSSFEMPSDPKAGTFNIGDKLKLALTSARIRLPRQWIFTALHEIRLGLATLSPIRQRNRGVVDEACDSST